MSYKWSPAIRQWALQTNQGFWPLRKRRQFWEFWILKVSSFLQKIFAKTLPRNFRKKFKLVESMRNSFASVPLTLAAFVGVSFWFQSNLTTCTQKFIVFSLFLLIIWRWVFLNGPNLKKAPWQPCSTGFPKTRTLHTVVTEIYHFKFQKGRGNVLND